MSASNRPRRSTAHPCPGGCGVQVPKRQLACRSCWYLLPTAHREEVTGKVGTIEHLGAVGDALIWYRENVTDGELVDRG